MAEYYHLTDPDALPPSLFATLAAGLPEGSRTMRALSGRRVDTGTLLMAAAVDRLTYLVWMQTKDGAKGRNRPKSIAENLTREEKAKPYSVPAEDVFGEIERIRRGIRAKSEPPQEG